MQGVRYTSKEMKAIKAEIVAYIEKTPGGTFYIACKKAKVGLTTAHAWRLKDPAFEKAVTEARKIADGAGGDIAETTLMNAIINKNMTATIFYLKTKHKERGYIERSELTGANGGAMRTTPFTRVDPEQAARDYLDMVAADKPPGT